MNCSGRLGKNNNKKITPLKKLAVIHLFVIERVAHTSVMRNRMHIA